MIAPISRPASAAASAPHLSQPSTVVINAAPGADPSAGGFGTTANAGPAEPMTAPAVATPAATALRHTRPRTPRPTLSLIVFHACLFRSGGHACGDRSSRAPTPGRRQMRQHERRSTDAAQVGDRDVKVLAFIALPAVLLIGTLSVPVLLANGDPPPLVACAPNAASTERSSPRSDASSPATTTSPPTAAPARQAPTRSSTPPGTATAATGDAVDAPPDTQDAKATEMVAAILARYPTTGVPAVPVVWYIGHLPPPGSTRWDTVPVPEAGNRLTPRQYQQRWLTTYNELATTPPAEPSASPTPDVLPPGCTGGASGETLPGGWALPGPRALLDATADQLDNPHHDYPAWDWIIPTGTPIYAIRGGTVVTVQAWPHNWWEQGCRQRGVNGCATCGIGVTILDPTDNTRWTYCHGSNLHVTQGAHVEAGQLLITSGNTGRSGTPHLHLEIRTADGIQRCPQDLLLAS